jgi:hypothetical protein
MIERFKTIHRDIASEAVDFAHALPLADVFITNGGLHSLSWALHHRCHCIVLPTQAEQAATALRLARHPQVSVGMDASTLGALVAQACAKPSLPKPQHSQPKPSAEHLLMDILRGVQATGPSPEPAMTLATT